MPYNKFDSLYSKDIYKYDDFGKAIEYNSYDAHDTLDMKHT